MTDQIKGSRLLVIGGAGFIGSNLVLKLLDYDPANITIVDNLLSSDISNVPNDPRVVFRFGSITDEKILKDISEDIDYIWHLSCFHGNQSSIFDPMLDHENNTLTTLKLLERIKHFSSLKKLVYAAAGCAVAEKTFDKAEATFEDAPVSLYHDSPYSISKIIGELYGNYYWRQHNVPFVKCRFQNVYGPREILGAGQWRGTRHTVWRNVTPTFIWQSLNSKALQLDNGGVSSRDFIFVEDMARGLIAAALRGKAGEIYNLASGIETNIKDLAEMINKLTGNPIPPDISPARDWDRSGKRFGSTAKSKEKLGFEATVTLRDGLEKTIAWTRAHQETIARCIHQHDLFMASL